MGSSPMGGSEVGLFKETHLTKSRSVLLVGAQGGFYTLVPYSFSLTFKK